MPPLELVPCPLNMHPGHIPGSKQLQECETRARAVAKQQQSEYMQSQRNRENSEAPHGLRPQMKRHDIDHDEADVMSDDVAILRAEQAIKADVPEGFELQEDGSLTAVNSAGRITTRFTASESGRIVVTVIKHDADLGNTSQNYDVDAENLRTFLQRTRTMLRSIAGETS